MSYKTTYKIKSLTCKTVPLKFKTRFRIEENFSVQYFNDDQKNDFKIRKQPAQHLYHNQHVFLLTYPF